MPISKIYIGNRAVRKTSNEAHANTHTHTIQDNFPRHFPTLKSFPREETHLITAAGIYRRESDIQIINTSLYPSPAAASYHLIRFLPPKLSEVSCTYHIFNLNPIR